VYDAIAVGTSTGATIPAHRGVRARRREVLLAYLLLVPAVILVLGLQAYPLIWQLWFSLTNFSPVSQPAVAFIGLRNYTEFFRSPAFWYAAANTAGYIVATGVLKLAVGIAMALVLHRPFPGRPLVYLAAFLPWAYPAGVGIICWYWFMTPPLHTSYGPFMVDLRLFFDRYVGEGSWGFLSLILFNIWRGGSFTAILLLAALNGIPQDLFDYAVLEVKSAWRKFWMVIVPLLRPFLALAAFLSLTSAVGDLGSVWTMTGGRIVYPIVWTQAMHYAMLGGQWGKAFALSFIPLPVLLLILFVCYRLFEPLEEDPV
jgi:multiple sugar transport system permease protein